jgi:2-polyprenyl-6-methoxyphenol hydroxylase-like FAD-dependent oxidoreductase
VIMRDKRRIAIVGAGPGGLTLARILHLHGIHASVFEREEHSSVRTQRRSLDMHAESGQFAIRCAGLSAEFKSIARYQDQEQRIYDKYGNLLFEDTSNEGDRPEVDRTQLRQMLLDSLPEGVTRWHHKLLAAKPQDDGSFQLAFENGVTETFDLVVGADGAWSRIRPLVSEARPTYSGVMFVEFHFDDVDTKYPEIATLVGHGMMFAIGDSKALIGHRDAEAHISIGVGLRVPEDWVVKGGIDMSSAEAVRNSLAANFHGWSENLRQVIYQCDGRPRLWPISALPIGHKWEHRPGITLLGDAAHLMSPFSGEGANLAMLDAADLALELASAGRDWDAAIQRFELKMFARAAIAAVGAKDGIDQTFSENGLSLALQQMEGHRV